MAAWDDILGASGPRVRFGQELEDYLSSKQIEKITGTTAERPELGKLMKKLAPGDVVITPAVDRLSRDTTDLLVIAREMARNWMC